MQDLHELKALMRVLAERPRLAIVDAIVRRGSADNAEIALALRFAPYEIEPHLTALHEAGVLVLENDHWHVSPRVKAKADGEFLRFAAKTRDGGGVELRYRPVLGQS